MGDLLRALDRYRLQQPLLLFAGGGEEDAVVGCAEHRLSASLGDPLGRPALDRHDIKAGVAAVERGGQESVGRLAIGDQAAIGRKGGFDIVAGFGGDDAAFAAADTDHLDPCRLVVVPRDVGDAATVARKGRIAFELIATGQAPGIAAAAVCDPDVAKRFIDNPRPIRTLLGEAHHLGLEAGRGDILLLPDGVLDEARSGDMERDFADLPGGNVDAMNSALRPENDRLAVGRPAHSRIDALDRPGFLHVAVEDVGERSDAAGIQVHQHQRRFVADPADEGQALAVGRRGRADRAARAADQRFDFARLPVQSLDDVDLAVDVLRIFENVARRRVVGEIEVTAVGREGRLVGILLLGAGLGHLHARAAALPVIEPHFARAQ